MSYVANKPIRINGKMFLKGDIINPEDMAAYEGARLKHYGIISEVVTDNRDKEISVNSAEISSKDIVITLNASDNGTENILADIGSIQEVFSIAQLSSDEAVTAILNITDINVYKMLNAVEHRQKPKAALKKISDKLPCGNMDANETSENNIDNDVGGDK